MQQILVNRCYPLKLYSTTSALLLAKLPALLHGGGSAAAAILAQGVCLHTTHGKVHAESLDCGYSTSRLPILVTWSHSSDVQSQEGNFSPYWSTPTTQHDAQPALSGAWARLEQIGFVCPGRCAGWDLSRGAQAGRGACVPI